MLGLLNTKCEVSMDYKEPDCEMALKPLQAGFLSDRLAELVDLKQAIKKGNLDYASRLAHQWKGFAEPYGFKHLAQIAVNFEHALLKSASQDELDQLSLELEKYLEFKKEQLGA